MCVNSTRMGRFYGFCGLACDLIGSDRREIRSPRRKDKPGFSWTVPQYKRTAMMKKISIHDRSESFFAQYRFPDLTFEASDLPFEDLGPMWIALRKQDHMSVKVLAMSALANQDNLKNEERAAINLALAAAAFQAGDLKTAKRQAGRSLDLFPKQFAANAILLSILARRKGFAAAYHQLLNLSLPKKTPSWDEPLTFCEVQTALASWAWQLGEWDHVAAHLARAYPKGLAEMPPELREEWFRLSLYRGHPEDAAAAAAFIIDQSPIESADELLQTIVKSGWTKEALPLYREAYAKHSKSELLRRRLVALCIREGELDEARALTTTGALRMAA